MKETGIIMSGNQPQLVLYGTKTQTRRVIVPQPTPSDTHDWDWKPGGMLCSDGYFRQRAPYHCPYGQVGDRLWVRETHFRFGKWGRNGITKTGRQRWRFKGIGQYVKYIDAPPAVICRGKDEIGWFKRPSIHMPRCASRITLEIIEVRAERVQEISNDDAKAEGVEPLVCGIGAGLLGKNGKPLGLACHYISPFRILWDSLNAKRGYGWEENPWVFPISFRRIEL